MKHRPTPTAELPLPQSQDMSGHRCQSEKLPQTSSSSSSSKLHKERLMLCSTSNGILAEHHYFLHKLWCGFAHAKEFFPLIKHVINLSSFPLVKPATYSLGLGGQFFSWGHIIFMLALNRAFKTFYETSGSFVYLCCLLFLPQRKHEHSLPLL